MNLKKYILSLSLFNVLSIISLEASPVITPEMKKKAEIAIQSCEKSYQNTKQLRAKFDQIKKPGLFSSQKKKDAYKNLEVNKKIFDTRFSEFTRFTRHC